MILVAKDLLMACIMSDMFGHDRPDMFGPDLPRFFMDHDHIRFDARILQI